MRILLTGATGFVGRGLMSRLSLLRDVELRAAVRGRAEHLPSNVEAVQIAGLSADSDWRPALAGVDRVVHAAGRAHVMEETAKDALAAYRAVNVAGTLNLARQAARAGVGRFVFISSIKVNGEETPAGRRYAADDVPAPRDAYGISKLEAEQGLQALGAESGMEIVVIRPPLIYGPGVRANFLKMMRWLASGVPLPLGAIHHNRRSLVALDNLVGLVVTCLDHPAAANQVFLAGDGEDLSTTVLLRRLAAVMNVSARLVPVPVWALERSVALFGRQAAAQRLLRSLQVDISKTREVLGWTPPVSLNEGLSRVARDFVRGREAMMKAERQRA